MSQPPPAPSPSPARSSTRVHPARVAVAAVVGVLALVAVVAPLGWRAVLDATVATSLVPWLVVAGLTVVLVVTRVERARILLDPAPSYRLMFPILNASFLLAIATPGRVGALLRPAWLGRHGIAAGGVVVGMVAERLLDLVAITLLLLLTLAWAMPEVPPELVDGVGTARVVLGTALATGLVGLAMLPWVRRVLDRLLAPRPWAQGLRRFIDTLAEGASALVRHPGRSARAVGWTTVHWGLGLSMGACIVASIDPALLRLDVVVSLWTGVMLANVLSPTPGGVGAYEAAGTAILVAHGVPEAQALAGVLVGHATTLGVQAVFGLAGWVGLGVDAVEDATGPS